ncbi:hypothetical protein [Bradyrhizobium sp.]|uniref:hypothetical protein n=1 Tax=Bradyrhizobium sp. TaxID=376 RepID=UPI001D3B60E4|nr:hypothetical protein [Bradyrhizobium sp.]MBI5320605.1 hypothetical protein [Bradyrhizobium sp.]
MLKIAILIWVMLGTAVAGTAVTAVLAAGIASDSMRAIPLAALAGFVVAMPLSYFVAAKIARDPSSKRIA